MCFELLLEYIVPVMTMADIKIPSGPTASKGPGTIAETDAPEAGPDVLAVEGHGADPVTRIASRLASGKIDKERAIDLMIEHTLDSEMVAAAPEGLREELASVLDSAIRTDPHLRSLAREMGMIDE